MTLSATDIMAITEIDGIPSELDAGDPSITDALTSEGVEAAYEGTLVPYMRLEAKREFTELNGGLRRALTPTSRCCGSRWRARILAVS